jgi:hypothetical protein
MVPKMGEMTDQTDLLRTRRHQDEKRREQADRGFGK